MNVVADIANAIRDGRLDEARAALLGREDRVYREIEGLVGKLVDVQNERMPALRTAWRPPTGGRSSSPRASPRSRWRRRCCAGSSSRGRSSCRCAPRAGFLGQVTAGDLGATIAVPNRDEFGGSAERMNQHGRELQRLADEQQRAAAELRALNERLEQASRAKSEFLANMSHELRTPMNAILGFTEMMRDGLYGEVPAELEEPLADIQANGRHLLRLINDVLDLSKIEAGRMELVLHEYSVVEVVEAVRASLRSLAADKGLEFVAQVEPDLPIAHGDAKRITQCLMNLAGNALKFTRQGRVEIGADARRRDLVYRVTDTGIGIPKDELENVFAEFRQVDATVTREFGGTGLGLSITKKFVEMHGGRIWVESEPGQGSTFRFSIPLRVQERA